jgi:hypothetical protein
MKILVFIILSSSSICNADVSTQIDANQMLGLQEYVQNFRHDLIVGLNTISRLPVQNQVEELKALVDKVMAQEHVGQNTYYARNLLARIRLLYAAMESAEGPKKPAQLRQILKNGITWAIELSSLDADRLNPQSTHIPRLEFSKMGLDWLDYVLYVFYQMPSNSSRLQIALEALGVAYNDIADDDHLNRALAPVMDTIVKESARLRALPQATNLDVLAAARQARSVLESVAKSAERILRDVKVERDPTRFIFNQIQFANVREVDMQIYVPQKRKGKDCTWYICVGDVVYAVGQKAVITRRISRWKSIGLVSVPGRAGSYYEFAYSYNGRQHGGVTQFSEFHLAEGCYFHVCLGKTVYMQYSEFFIKQTVVSYNPYEEGFGMSPADYFTYIRPGAVYVTENCYQGICVGMKSGLKEVVGINPLTKKYLVSDSTKQSYVVDTPAVELMSYEEVTKLLF